MPTKVCSPKSNNLYRAYVYTAGLELGFYLLVGTKVTGQSNKRSPRPMSSKECPEG